MKNKTTCGECSHFELDWPVDDDFPKLGRCYRYPPQIGIFQEKDDRGSTYKLVSIYSSVSSFTHSCGEINLIEVK